MVIPLFYSQLFSGITKSLKVRSVEGMLRWSWLRPPTSFAHLENAWLHEVRAHWSEAFPGELVLDPTAKSTGRRPNIGIWIFLYMTLCRKWHMFGRTFTFGPKFDLSLLRTCVHPKKNYPHFTHKIKLCSAMCSLLCQQLASWCGKFWLQCVSLFRHNFFLQNCYLFIANTLALDTG